MLLCTVVEAVWEEDGTGKVLAGIRTHFLQKSKDPAVDFCFDLSMDMGHKDLETKVVEIATAEGGYPDVVVKTCRKS